MSESQLVSLDVWLLHAIALAYAPGGARLRDIIACGDYLNHAVFMFEEFQGGLGRLLAGGHVLRAEHGFQLCQECVEIYKQITQQTRSIRKHGLALSAYLEGQPTSSAPAETGLTDVEFDRAIQEYQAGFT
jgi:hypothetical protein